MPTDHWAKAYESACSDPRLKDRDFRVYIAVRIRTGDDGACWESVETIGKRAGGMDAKTVRRALKVLKTHRYLNETKAPDRKTGRYFTLVKNVPTLVKNVPEPGTNEGITPVNFVRGVWTELTTNLDQDLDQDQDQ